MIDYTGLLCTERRNLEQLEMALKELKKYANRKIYDPEERHYVTIRDVCKMVRNHIQVKVIDDKTGKDITRSILLQVLNDLEAESGTTVLTDYVLENMIRMYDDPMSKTFALYLDHSLKN
ncbi:MAG: polyhydroxyalkanoate synthesis regulator DNA-binding domain-containing protein, partial [Pseudomonadales bacterium]